MDRLCVGGSYTCNNTTINGSLNYNQKDGKGVALGASHYFDKVEAKAGLQAGWSTEEDQKSVDRFHESSGRVLRGN